MLQHVPSASKSALLCGLVALQGIILHGIAFGRKILSRIIPSIEHFYSVGLASKRFGPRIIATPSRPHYNAALACFHQAFIAFAIPAPTDRVN
jgi:hypothetical protein